MNKKMNRVVIVSILLALPWLSGCSGIAPKLYDLEHDEMVDPTKGLTKEDYLALPMINQPTTKVSTAAAEPPIPELAPILSAPPVPKLGQTKLVSIAVTDDVPLKDVLLELSRLADVDMQIDASIQGGITFRANQRPFNEVIERVCEFAGLRYKMKNGILTVERDTPFVEMYTLDFLNMQRDSSNSVSLTTNVLSAAEGDKGSLQTGSTTSVTSNIKSDFWEKFNAGIAQILAFVPERRMSEFSAPQAQVAAAPSVASAFPAAPESTTLPPTGGAAAGGAPVAPAAAAPTPAAAPAATAPATPASAIGYTINQQAGTLTVMATERQHRLIKEFIKRIEYNASAQVLIEAKIIEVTLNEQYQTGIDWSDLGSRSLHFDSVKYGGISEGLGGSTLNVNKGLITGLNINLDGLIDLMQKFGTTRTLSSPRLHAINNQQAILTFAKNEVYFNVGIEKEETDATATSVAKTTFTVSTEIKTVPIGIILSLLPSINRDTGDITINIRPTLSRVVDRVTDPTLPLIKAIDPDFADIDVENKIPVVEVRELDSILKAQSGQVMVIGGLMEDRAGDTETGLPGAQDIPVLGNLFKGVDRSRSTTELVILIRPTLIGTSGRVDAPDRALYEKFGTDPRPLEFK